MPSAQLDICNQALSHLGISTEIQDIAERSKEAGACRRFYDQVIAETLRDFPWPFATAYVSLAQVATNPTTEWAYSYRLPSDCITVRRIVSGARPDVETTRIPFALGQDAQGGLLYTSVTDATDGTCPIEYTTNAVAEGRFSADFAATASLYLAGLIAPRVTKGGDFKLGDRALTLYRVRRDAAWANAAQESAQTRDEDSSFTRARC